MPCNLAVSITKAAVSEQRLRDLLTASAVSVVVNQYLSLQYAGYQPRVVVEGQDVIATVGQVSVRIQNGLVTAQTSTWPSPDERRLADQLANELTKLLGQAADVLFAQQVQQALAQLTSVTAQRITVDNQGVAQQAVVLTMKL